MSQTTTEEQLFYYKSIYTEVSTGTDTSVKGHIFTRLVNIWMQAKHFCRNLL